jgi:signal transduction histidine kinase
MEENAVNLLIVGAGKKGVALIKELSGDEVVNIVGVVDANANAPGIKLAKKFNIPASTNLQEFLNKNRNTLDEIVNLTGNQAVQEELLKIKPADVGIVSGQDTKLIWNLIEKRKQAEEELKQAKEELEAQDWGLKKTNDAIKLLYKELESKNKRLQELDRLKSDFISTVSHELRTPLSITKEGISLVLDQIPGKINEKQEKILTTAKNNIDRLARIIDNLLDISKIEAGKVELKKELVNIKDLIKQLALSFEPKMKERGLEIKVNIAKGEINIYADADKITQVFTNLIYNAIKFTKNGFIEVSARERNNEVECTVADTGIGISQEDLPKVFSKFQQFGRSPGPGEKGTGLGLSIAKGIVELHRGKIRVESKLGKGTKFIFTLPKYSVQTILSEYINEAIEQADKKNVKMSLVIFSITELNKSKQKFSPNKMKSILKDLEGVLKNNISRQEDIVLAISSRLITLLVNCDKENALKVAVRFEEILQDYLNGQNLAQQVKLRSDCITYPDETTDAQELMKKVIHS